MYLRGFLDEIFVLDSHTPLVLNPNAATENTLIHTRA